MERLDERYPDRILLEPEDMLPLVILCGKIEQLPLPETLYEEVRNFIEHEIAPGETVQP